jgi:hypothetical protein
LAEPSDLSFTGSLEVARQTGRAAGGPLKQLTLEPGDKLSQLAAATARACALVDPPLKAATACGHCPPTNARLHQNIHYGAPSWPCDTEPITAQNESLWGGMRLA